MEEIKNKFKNMIYIKDKKIFTTYLDVQNDIEDEQKSNESTFIDDDFSSKEKDVIPSYETKEVGFCPHCHKMSFTIDWGELKEEYSNKKPYNSSLFNYSSWFKENHKGEMIITCPECGADLTGYKQKVLETNSSYYWNNCEEKCYNIVEKDDKLIIGFFFNIYYPNKKVGKLSVQRYNFRITFNLKTGQTYLFEIRETDGKKRKPNWCPGVRLKNITYSGSTMTNGIQNKFLNNKQVLYDIAKALVKAKNGKLEDLFYPHEIEEIESDIARKNTMYTWEEIGGTLGFHILTIYNKLPGYNRKFYDTANKWISDINNFYYKEIKKENRKRKTFLRKLSQEEDKSQLLNWILEKNGIPNTKKLKKIISKNPIAATTYQTITELGFKNHDVILSIFENYTEYLMDINRHLNNSRTDSKEKIITFIADLIAKKGEPVTKKMIFNDNFQYSILKDTANMYHTFKAQGFLNNEYLKGTLREMHDKFSLDYRKVKTQNLTISYKEEILNLNDRIDDYEFILAKDTHQLIEVGTKMGICVGSYGIRAAENRVIIVLTIEKNKYVGCIELDNTGKRLVQAKAKFNNVLQEKKAEALKKWIVSKEIQTDNCYDYKHIKNGEIEYDESKIYQSTHNYAAGGYWDDLPFI